MPERVTEYERNEAGQVIRSTEYVESAWDETERGLMLALAEYEAGLCPHCGNPTSVCQDPDSDRNNPHAKWIYWALPPAVCNIGTAMKAGQKEYDHPDKAVISRVARTRRGEPRPY